MKYDRLTFIGKLKTAYELLNEGMKDPEFAELTKDQAMYYGKILGGLFLIINRVRLGSNNASCI